MQMIGLNRTVVVRADAEDILLLVTPTMSFALVSVDFLFPVRAALAGCGKAINRGTPLSMHGQGSPASRAIPAPYFFTPARRRTREIVYSYLLLYLPPGET